MIEDSHTIEFLTCEKRYGDSYKLMVNMFNKDEWYIMESVQGVNKKIDINEIPNDVKAQILKDIL